MNNGNDMKIDTVSLCAYAKINLHLRVFENRPDGYHAIESVFQRISIADYISVTACPHENSCGIESPLLPLPAVNTIRSAWKVFQKALSICAGIHVRVLKHIPAGSGLGGGSSDAAALLCAADALFQTNLSRCDIAALAAQVGSDVPFFAEPYAAAFVTGRGELVTALPPRADVFGILIVPPVAVSAKAAYAAIDACRLKTPVCLDKARGFEYIKSHYSGSIAQWPFLNDFQPVIEGEYTVVKAACSDLYAHGAVFAQMSGSGAAVFGLFQDEACFADALRELSRTWQWCKPFLLLA